MRELFESRLKKLVDDYPLDWKIFSKSKYDQLISDVLKAKEKSVREPAEKLLLLRFDVITENNIEKLVKPSSSNPYKYHAHQDELYDIIYNKHIEMDHAVAPEVFKSLQIKYINIPLTIINLCLSLCEGCSSLVNDYYGYRDNTIDEKLIKPALQDDECLTSRMNSEKCEILVIDLVDDDEDDGSCAAATDKETNSFEDPPIITTFTPISTTNTILTNSAICTATVTTTCTSTTSTSTAATNNTTNTTSATNITCAPSTISTAFATNTINNVFATNNINTTSTNTTSATSTISTAFATNTINSTSATTYTTNCTASSSTTTASTDNNNGKDNNNVDNVEEEGEEEIEIVKTVINCRNVADVILSSSSESSPEQSANVSHEQVDDPITSSDPVQKEAIAQKDRNKSSVTVVTFGKEFEYEDDDNTDTEDSTEVSLCWNLYGDNFKSLLCNYLYGEQFVDVTLTCQNGSINCHKMILSVCSPYFEKIFTQNPTPHLTVFLKDIYFWELKVLLEFIYKGEVKVPRCKLESLLHAAESLQIKGLVNPVSGKKIKNQQSKRIFRKKLNGIKNCNAVRKFIPPEKVKICNKNTLSMNDKTENTSQTLPDLKPDSINLNGPSQITDSVPNSYGVVAQTYLPVTNQNSLINQNNLQNFIPINQPSYNIQPFAQILHAPVPSFQTIHQQVPLSSVPYTAVPVHQISNDHLPEAVSTPTTMQNNPSPRNTFVVSCSSSTQTSPCKGNYFEDESYHNEGGYQIVNSSAKKPKLSSSHCESDKEQDKISTNVLNKSKCDTNKKTIRRKTKDQSDRISEKINCLISGGQTNIVFTGKKTADMESIAGRTKKRHSVKRKRKPRFDFGCQ